MQWHYGTLKNNIQWKHLHKKEMKSSWGESISVAITKDREWKTLILSTCDSCLKKDSTAYAAWGSYLKRQFLFKRGEWKWIRGNQLFQVGGGGEQPATCALPSPPTALRAQGGRRRGLPMVQCSPFQPWLHSHLPSLHVPCSAQRGWQALWLQAAPVQPSSQRQVPPMHTPCEPQSTEQISALNRGSRAGGKGSGEWEGAWISRATSSTQKPKPLKNR